MSSSQLTKSYFSEGWPNHQPVYIYICIYIYSGYAWDTNGH